MNVSLVRNHVTILHTMIPFVELKESKSLPLTEETAEDSLKELTTVLGNYTTAVYMMQHLSSVLGRYAREVEGITSEEDLLTFLTTGATIELSNSITH